MEIHILEVQATSQACHISDADDLAVLLGDFETLVWKADVHQSICSRGILIPW